MDMGIVVEKLGPLSYKVKTGNEICMETHQSITGYK